MADYYDPFGLDEGEAAAEAATPAGVVTATNTKTKKAPKELKEALSKTLLDAVTKDQGWKNIDVMAANFDWYTKTCSRYDWRHRDVKLEFGNGVAYLILNRPNENNSMQDTLTAGFNDGMFTLGSDECKDIRVLVFTGEGRMFCAGGDPKMWQAAAARARGEKLDGDGTVGFRIPMLPPTDEVNKDMIYISKKATVSKAFSSTTEPGTSVHPSKLMAAKSWHTFCNLPQFTVALINGSAMGGGVGYTSICDYVIAVKKAYFTTSEVRIGVIPATISPYVCAKIGSANAKRFFATAENLKAEKAVPVGLVNEVVENMKEGHVKVKGILEQLSKCSPAALARIKKLVCTTSGQPINEPTMFYSGWEEANNISDKAAQEGLACATKGEQTSWEQDVMLALY